MSSATAVSSKSTVFVLGGSGNTGASVVDGLLQSGNFNVIVLTRPESEKKDRIQALKEKGVEIRLGDLSKASVVELEALLKGVDIVMSLVIVFEDQKKIFQAAKNVGVSRVVPSDFATACPPEREHQLSNKKWEIRSFIQGLGLGYTFIDVGWWMELILPKPPNEKGDRLLPFVDPGDVKTAVTAREDIGRFVARILADPRTLNKYVFCHAEEVTLKEVYRIAKEVSGENFDSVTNHASTISAKDVSEIMSHEMKNHTNGPQLNIKLIVYQYVNSLFVQGDNTVENAKRLGALDVLALYPDIKPIKIKDYAVEFYKKRPGIEYEH